VEQQNHVEETKESTQREGPSICVELENGSRLVSDDEKNNDEDKNILSLLFKSSPGCETEASIRVMNTGSTAMYFRWTSSNRKPTSPSPFRFLENVSGTLLPNATCNSRVIFRSPPSGGGMFRDTFSLETTPSTKKKSLKIKMRGSVVDVVPGTFYDHEKVKDQIAKEKTRRYFERLVDGTSCIVHLFTYSRKIKRKKYLHQQLLGTIRRALAIPTTTSKLLQNTRRALFENRNTDKGVSLRYHYSPATWKRCALVYRRARNYLKPFTYHDDEESWNGNVDTIRSLIEMVRFVDTKFGQELTTSLDDAVRRSIVRAPEMSNAFVAGRSLVQCLVDIALGDEDQDIGDAIDMFEKRVQSLNVQAYRDRQNELNMLLKSKMSIHQCDDALKDKNVLLRLDLNLETEVREEEEEDKHEGEKEEEEEEKKKNASEKKKILVVSDTARNTALLDRAAHAIREVLSRGCNRVVIVTSMHDKTSSLRIVREALEFRLGGNPINFVSMTPCVDVVELFKRFSVSQQSPPSSPTKKNQDDNEKKEGGDEEDEEEEEEEEEADDGEDSSSVSSEDPMMMLEDDIDPELKVWLLENLSLCPISSQCGDWEVLTSTPFGTLKKQEAGSFKELQGVYSSSSNETSTWTIFENGDALDQDQIPRRLTRCENILLVGSGDAGYLQLRFSKDGKVLLFLLLLLLHSRTHSFTHTYTTDVRIYR